MVIMEGWGLKICFQAEISHLRVLAIFIRKLAFFFHYLSDIIRANNP